MLPQRWCINRTRDNHLIVNKWANDQKLTLEIYSAEDGYIYSEPVNTGKQHVLSDTDGLTLYSHSDFTEITFKDFINYVVNKELFYVEYSYLIPFIDKLQTI